MGSAPDSLRNPERLAALADTHLPDSVAEEAAEDGLQQLIAELHHRVKNTLSTVQALIQLNLRSSPTLAVFRGTIGGRIESLAKTHTLLTPKRWHAIAFRDILDSELDPYQQTERVSLSGPNFDLEARS